MENTTAPMSKELSATNRKTHRMIAKNLIILLVVAIIAALAIWAWFTQGGGDTTADGISMEARAGGVKVSWTVDGTYYTNLTATTADDVDNTAYSKGLAYTIPADEAQLKLVTGNGLKFFSPLVNRRTGDILLNDDNSWQGADITGTILKNASESWQGTLTNTTNQAKTGRYIDVDLYFKSDEQKDVYLAADSLVSPKSTTERMSAFGNFSKDYICSAARLAFFDASDNTKDPECKFIWAPNSNYQLVANEEGYTRISPTETTETVTVGGGIDGGAVNDGKTYYFWTIAESANPQTGQREVNRSIQFNYDEAVKYFVAEITYTVPTYTDNSPSIPFLISESSTSPLVNTFDIDKDNSFSQMYNNNSPSLIYISNQGYNAATFNGNSISESLGRQFYFRDPAPFKTQTTVKIKFGFNPATGIIQVIGYEGGASWDQGAAQTIEQTVYTYSLDNDDSVALANIKNAVAVSADANVSGYAKSASVYLDSTTKVEKININSIMATEQFIVNRTGEGTAATYTFKNLSTGKYLSVASNGTVSLSDTATSFSLTYDANVNGPLITYNNMYLAYVDGTICAVSTGSVNANNVVTVFKGTSYTFNTNGIVQAEYKYYDSTTKKLEDLNSASTPPLYATKAYVATEGETVGTVNEIPVVSLSKAEGSSDYTGHIIIRIWAEGSDRDALTPLANGIFTTSLHFISKTNESATTGR